MIKDSGERTEFESGAVRDMHEGKGRFDLLPMCVLLRLARHYENGCRKYGDRNWEKGIPCHSFADSAMRHLVKYMDGQNDEDHLIAAIWNLCGLAWTEEKHPELMDIPARLEVNNQSPVIRALNNDDIDRIESYLLDRDNPDCEIASMIMKRLIVGCPAANYKPNPKRKYGRRC